MKGTAMKFQGVWVSSDQGKVSIAASDFDETELSDHSNWQEAWQNDDPDAPHGYLDSLAMLQDISRRIVGKIDQTELDVIETKFRSGIPFTVSTLEDLVQLIQVAIPSKIVSHVANSSKVEATQDDNGEEIPFE
ncbi:hypothetical protein [Novosphingobium aquae]|uniref:Uncharacterized protein n=1 Tax=Novosphingobium aquae TaxID=3133435 RepID=A0ABU8SA99_9SPHN